VSVCHCSVCRYDEALPTGKDNAKAPYGAAVKRSNCRIEIKKEAKLEYRESSDLARRGKCSLCNTFLIMDYEWFEPKTVWLVNPLWIKPGSTELQNVEFVYNDGKADFDVCWSSRNDPIQNLTCKDGYLKKAEHNTCDLNVTIEDGDIVMPRGVVQFADMDFNYFQIDCGSFN